MSNAGEAQPRLPRARAAAGGLPDARIGAGLMAVATLAILVLGPPGQPVQVIVLVAGVAVLGLPHGALDHRLAALLLGRPVGPSALILFLTLYGLLAGLVLAAWVLRPDVTLLLFLAVAWLHFGLGDQVGSPVPRDLNGWVRSLAGVLARGGAVLVAPALGHPETVAGIFAALGPVEPMSLTLGWIWGGGAIWAMGVLVWLGAHVDRTDARFAWTGMETSAIAAAGLLVSPLLAFTLYFCLLHAPRHMAEVAGWSGGPAAGPGRRSLIRDALPLTVATWVLAALAWPWLREAGTEPGLLRMVFWGLAALTLPHMLLATAAQIRCRPAHAAGVTSSPGGND